MFLALHFINYLSNALISEMIAKYMENIKQDEEIPMSEFIPMFEKFATDIQRQVIDLKYELKQRFDKIDERFDKIDQTLSYHETRFNNIDRRLDGTVDKSAFERLVKILERKEIISKYESSHVLNPIKTTP